MADIKLEIQANLSPGLRVLQRMRKQLEALPREAYDYFVSQTPIDTGRARRSTRLVGNNIQADYPYAQRLDEGYSDQSPEGMTRPTEKFVERRLRSIARGR